MEVCGGQTHTFVKSGLDRMLPAGIELIHGPGCPVCVTPIELIDRAIAIARRPEVILASFGDMLRVPGSGTDLLGAKAQGADVRIVYSPLDAMKLAARHPEREVVFFAVGFETTAPPNVASVLEARRLGLANYSILCAQVRVPPAMEAILAAGGARVQAFLAAGHVCTVMGYEEYEPIAERFTVPIVVTGFEPVDLLQGIQMTVSALEEGRTGVENQYARSVRREGNRHARAMIEQVFEVCDRQWRGIGRLPQSGFRLRAAFEEFDAERRFDTGAIEVRESELCIAGEILQGLRKPVDCAQFGKGCTPERPLGAPMVSSEGTCAAYYRFGDRMN
jgi:hydrogenase expression/formation protein HypD